MRRLRWLVTLVVAGLVISFAANRWYVHAQAEEAIKVNPFVAELEDYAVVNGVEKPTTHYVLARRSDAAQARVGVMYHDQLGPITSMRRIDHPNGLVAMMSDRLKMISSGYKPDASIAQHKKSLMNPMPECHGGPEQLAGIDMMFGYQTYRIVFTRGDGLQRTTSWRLADFNCMGIGILSESRASISAPWKIDGGSHLLAFAAQEPKPELFNVSTDYAEVKPSELHGALLKNAGVTPSTCPKCFTPGEADQIYNDWHK